MYNASDHRNLQMRNHAPGPMLVGDPTSYILIDAENQEITTSATLGTDFTSLNAAWWHPPISAGVYTAGCLSVVSATTATYATGSLWVTPIHIPTALTLTSFAVGIGNAVANARLIMVIYDDLNGYPNALIDSTASTACAAAGIYVVAGAAVVRPVLHGSYWIGISMNAQGATCTVNRNGVASLGRSSYVVGNTLTALGMVSCPHVFLNALPDPFGAITNSALGGPRVMIFAS